MATLNLSGFHLTYDDEFSDPNAFSVSPDGTGAKYADTRYTIAGDRIDQYSDIGFGHSSFVDPGSGKNPFTVSGGALTITATPDSTPYGYPGSWESGLITTAGKFSQAYGYFEVRGAFSNVTGGWDAFWLLPDTPIRQADGSGGSQELDVVEHYGNYGQGVYSTIHTNDPLPAGETWQQDRQVFSTLSNPAGYHTYGMDWEPDAIKFYVDGMFVGQQATPSDMTGPMYLIENLAVQNNASNDATIANIPISQSIDYIRVFSKDPTKAAATQAIVSAPDGSDPGVFGATVTKTVAGGFVTMSGFHASNGTESGGRTAALSGYGTFSSPFSTAGTITATSGKVLTLAGATRLTSGRIFGAGTLDLTKAVTLAGNSATTFEDVNVRLSGTLNDVTDLILSGTARFSVEAGAKFTLSGSGTPSIAQGTGATGAFSNKGLLSNTATGSDAVISAALVNTGTIQTRAANHALVLTGTVTGTGTINIVGAGTLEIGDSVASTQKISFTGKADGTLLIDGGGSFAGTVAGFMAGDTIDFGGLGSGGAKVSYKADAGSSSGLLTVQNGTDRASIKLAGEFLASAFTVASDRHGGAAVTYTPSVQQTIANLAAPHV